MDKKPSEVISEFIEFLEFAKDEHKRCFEEAGLEDKKVNTFMHDIELAPNRNERNKVATSLQKSRRKRRKAKDTALLYENIDKFCNDRNGQNFIKALRRLLNEQRMMENYLFGKREFKNRVD